MVKKQDKLGRSLWWEQPKEILTIRLEPYDFLIFEQLMRYRYLRWDLLLQLLPARSQQTMLKRLSKLWKARYISRPEGQLNDHNANYSRTYYAITDKGREAYLERFPEPYELTQLDGFTNFAHDAAGVCNSLASIEGGAKKAGYPIVTYEEVLERVPDVLDPFKFIAYVGNEVVKFRPDGFFGLLKDDQRKFFALEHERGNPNTRKKSSDRTSWEKKCLAYQDFMSKETYTEQLSISNLRLLVTTTSAAKAQHLAELTFDLIGKSNRFAFTDVPPLGHRSSPEYVYPDLFNDQLWLRPGLPSTTLKDMI